MAKPDIDRVLSAPTASKKWLYAMSGAMAWKVLILVAMLLEAFMATVDFGYVIELMVGAAGVVDSLYLKYQAEHDKVVKVAKLQNGHSEQAPQEGDSVVEADEGASKR